MPLQNSREHVGARPQEPVEAHAAFGRANLRRIGRRDRRDRVGEVKPGLEKSDPTVKFDTVHGHDLGRQVEHSRESARKQPLEREIMDRDHARRPAPKIGRHQARLPVVEMHEARLVARRQAPGDLGGDLGERAEAKRIVSPIQARAVDVRVALAPIEVRRVDHEELELACARFEQARRAAVKIAEGVDRPCLVEGGENGRISWNEGANTHALARQGERQGARDIREPPCLDQGKDFGSDRENFHRSDRRSANDQRFVRRSIIGCVTRQIPLSVRRKRPASALRILSDDETVRESRRRDRRPRSSSGLPAPILTYGKMTEFSTWARCSIRTPVKRSERRSLRARHDAPASDQ